MKHKLARRLLALTFFLLGFALAFAALAADAPTDPASVAAPPSWVLGLIEKYPVLATILLIVGGLRLVVKPIFAAAHWYAEQTDTPKDNEWLQRVEDSKALKVVVFILDWAASVKLVRK